jgi:hypothetical protein
LEKYGVIEEHDDESEKESELEFENLEMERKGMQQPNLVRMQTESDDSFFKGMYW